ncbi:amino acid permease [Neomoorella thermoacetica]|uniref:amino acid permease n=1 Tax=Neomoorella thermoacetica TaxID=1525 RepID=UPI0008FB7510|nr:amino acid permease [Moorella thermoacetica]OIQ62728.1 putative amino acid permease YhdG [Moorella thermoacetica]
MTFLFRRKSISEATELAELKEYKLRRDLNLLELFFLVIGATIGAGIFVLPGVAAAKYSGPAVSISFFLGGLVCICVGLCYVEFASMVPVAGSAYTYAYLALGEIFAWIVGWDLLFEFTAVTSTVSVGWSGYFVEFLRGFGIHLPKMITTDIAHGGFINAPAIIAILLVTYIVYSGIREAGKINAYLSLGKLCALALFLVLAIPFIKPVNWHPFLPFGWKGVMTGAALTFFAFTGFDGVTTVTEETKNPQRDVPIALVSGLGFITILYIVVSAVLTGVVPYTKLDVPDPAAFALVSIGKSWGGGIIAIAAIFGLFTVMMGNGLSATRILFAMSRDGLLPPIFARVHKTRRTPYIATLIIFSVALIGGGFLSIGELAELANIGGLTAFTLTAISTLVMRYSQPEARRPFKVPAIWVVAPLGIVGGIALISSLPPITFIRFGIWMVIGLVIYFSYGRKYSKAAIGG